jgi:hypothetical protein
MGPHGFDLVWLGDAPAVPLAFAAPVAQLAILLAQATGEQRQVDRLGAQLHRGVVRVRAAQEAGDLLRGPLVGEVVPHHPGQLRSGRELAHLRTLVAP